MFSDVSAAFRCLKAIWEEMASARPCPGFICHDVMVEGVPISVMQKDFSADDEAIEFDFEAENRQARHDHAHASATCKVPSSSPALMG